MAKADVTRLMGELDTANTRADTAEGEVTRLEVELDVANARIDEIEELAEDVLASCGVCQTGLPEMVRIANGNRLKPW